MSRANDAIERVAIAVIEHDGRYLVGTRRSDQSLAGQAEFPGGRCLPGEDGSACAVRESREETGLSVVAIRKLDERRHTYAHGLLDLEFWLCQLGRADDAERASGGFRWVPADSLNSLNFPEANQRVLKILTAGRPTTR